MIKRRKKNKSKNIYWIILTAAAVAALGIIFYSINNFHRDYAENARTTNALVIPKKERAFIEINFGGTKKRLFAAELKEPYLLEIALKSAAENGKFTFEIRRGIIQHLAGIGNTAKSWVIYKNNEIVTATIDQLMITGGDKYTFKFEK